MPWLRKSLMKIQTYQMILCRISLCLAVSLALATFCYLPSPQTRAADFSHAQQTFVPPSYIRRDLDALGTNNWSFPGLNSNPSAPNANTPNANPANANPDFGVGTLINRSGLNPPDSPGATENIGSVATIQKRVSLLIKAGQLADAENIARKGLKAFPSSGVLKNQFAAITALEAKQFLQGQNYDLAGKKARESLVAEPSNKISKSVIGTVLRSQSLDPNSAEGHVLAGDALTGDGRLLEASVEYKLALEIKPNAAAHVGLGSIAVGKGQITDASRHFERALSLDPNSSLAYRQRGALRYISKDIVGASADFSKAVSLNPNDPLAAEALVGLWKQQVSAYPNSVNSHLGLGRAYMQTQNLEAARSEYKAVVAIDPNNPILPAARAAFKLALAKQEADKCVQAAKTLDGQGAWSEAHQKLGEAIAYCPNDPQILLYNGQLCERLGLAAEAHDSYMSVLKSDPKNLQAAARLKALGYNNPVGIHATEGVLPMYGTQSPINGPLEVPLRNAMPSVNNSPYTNTSPAPSFPQTNGLVPPNSFPSINFPPANNTPAANFLPSESLPPINGLPATGSPGITPTPATTPFNGNPAPLPEEYLQNAPLKSPLAPKTQSNLPVPVGDAYYYADQNVYVGDSAHVTMLGNFGSCVRAIMMAEKQFLQTPPNNNNEYGNGLNNSDNLSSTQPNYF
jgi:tetratricopeptide (TPR) repeat protein